jgi:uncharacterized protein (TIGR02099 family)
VPFFVARFCSRTLYWVVVVLALLFALVVLTVKYLVLPNIERYQGEIINSVATRSGMDVSATAIKGGWRGFQPYVSLEDVVFREAAGANAKNRPAGTPALRLPKLKASLSWWSLFVGELRFSELSAEGPELMLSRAKDGLIYFAGQAVNRPKKPDDPVDDGALMRFLLEQPGLEIQNASLIWRDEISPGPDLLFTDVGFSLTRRGDRHSVGFVATPPTALARRIEARGDVAFNNSAASSNVTTNDAPAWSVEGSIFATATDGNIAELRRHVAVPDVIQTGLGNLRTWWEVDTRGIGSAGAGNRLPNNVPTNAPTGAPTSAPTSAGQIKSANATSATNPPARLPVRAVTADVHLINAQVRWDADSAPLSIAKLAGRIEYRGNADGLSISSKALELTTREGVVSPPADFSLTLKDQSDTKKMNGEITGNNIDLKVMAGLIESFPVGKDVRMAFAQYSPRGVVRDTSFAWTGDLAKPKTYKIKGALSEFGATAHAKLPGVTGFTGNIDGDNNGGRFNVASKNLELDMPEVFRAPLKFDALDSTGGWKKTADTFELALDKVAFAHPDLAGEISGTYSRFLADGARANEEKGPGTIDLKGKISRARAAGVPNFLPNGATKLREYLDNAIKAGDVASGDLVLKGALYEFPFQASKTGKFKLDLNLKQVGFLYATDWPEASAINGLLTIEGTKFVAKLDSARVFNAELKRTVLGIDDTALHPSFFTMATEIDARAEDVTKYLKESPLVNSAGAFTKIATLEGPGRLELSLRIPLGTAEERAASKAATAIVGRYEINRGSAKLALGGAQGTTISNLSGAVRFDESSVKSTNVTGTAFGNPIAVSISGGGEAGVVTEFNARAELSQLGEFIPRLPADVNGSTDFKGKVATKAGGMEVTIESPLVGVTSTLPYPLQKRADETRRLRVQMSNVGQAGEKLRLSIAGNASGDATQDVADSRVDARLQRRYAAGADGANKAQGFVGGIATLGETVGDAPIPEGLWLEGSVKQLDFDAWRRALDAYSPATKTASADAATSTAVPAKSDLQLAGFDLKLGQLQAYGRPFKALTLKGRRGAEDWRFVVDSAEASGDFTWRPGAFNERGAVRARLKTFILNDESGAAEAPPGISGVPATPSANETDFPALDIVADSFTLKKRWLGKLELRASPQSVNWKIDQLLITNGHAKLEMDGVWQRYGDPKVEQKGDASRLLAAGESLARTVMNVKLESSNLNALLDQFGYGEQMRGGRAKIEGQLSWPGHTYEFSSAKLSGNFKVDASGGSFAKVSPGAGKLLGLISLQSLPRRISLDFRDIFSEGFAFDKIEGGVKIENGVMLTENFQITGPSAEVKMQGEISLPNESANLIVTVQPRLDETVALGIGLATLNPLIGAAAWVGQKVIGNPIEKLFSKRLVVRGKWDEPKVEPFESGPSNNSLPNTSVPTAQPARPVVPTPAPTSTPVPNVTPTGNVVD